MKFFVINPGSTSTKIAVFEDDKSIFEKTARHNPEELKGYHNASSQLDYRFSYIENLVKEENINLDEIDAFIGRGGILRPLPGGTYMVNEQMLDDLKQSKYGDHASNLGAPIAARFAAKFGKQAYVVNPVVVDELMDEARYTGIPSIRRRCVFHALNQKAVAIRAAAEMGIPYEKGRFIVAHLGGGISVGAHEDGRIIDVNNAIEEGPFSPERAGNIPTLELLDLCFSGAYTKQQIKRMLVGGGGLLAYTGTSDCRDVEVLAKTDAEADKLLDSMAYKIAREICASAAALCGKVDRIIITGGIAYSPRITGAITKRVQFLGDVVIYPGEDEMAALAEGVIRVLNGLEQCHSY